MSIKLRPHHAICVLGFQGKGYSPEFVENFWRTLDKLETSEIEIITETDTLCSPCPHKRGKTCTEEERIQKLDQPYQKLLNLRPNQKLYWKELKNKAREKVSLNDFEQICSPCEWQKLGYCKEALEKLKTT